MPTTDASPAPASSPAVVCRGVTKRFASLTAVDDLDLELPRGECFGLLGPNGAGKTTTVEMLQGLLRPDAGQVRILGLDWRHDEPELRQRLGTQLQETRLPEKLSVREILTLFRSFHPVGLPVDDVLDLVQLGEKSNAWVRTLSGGQHQRLAIACALVGNPDLLFLDEPTTGLDPQSRRQLWEVIGDLHRRGTTILLTTHYMEEAERLCDRVGIMDRGRLIALGSPRELIRSLEAEHVVEFALGADTSPDAVVWEGLTHTRAIQRVGDRYRLTAEQVHQAVPELMRVLEREGLALSELTTHHATLEDVFLDLTGRSLRDG
ncbi:MAG: ABC transporter ATP-binding protein [Gemmatimonadota bacterium]|nr:ABC transporter ATP-binding protein [Gemmatimonadota bacterium]